MQRWLGSTASVFACLLALAVSFSARAQTPCDADVNGDGIFNASDNLAGQQVNGREVGPGRPTISGAKIFDSSGKPSGAGDPVKTGGDDINSGVDRGRQSWRRQPANP